MFFWSHILDLYKISDFATVSYLSSCWALIAGGSDNIILACHCSSAAKTLWFWSKCTFTPGARKCSCLNYYWGSCNIRQCDRMKCIDVTGTNRVDLIRPSIMHVSPGAVGLDRDPTDKVFFFADSGSPGSPNWESTWWHRVTFGHFE